MRLTTRLALFALALGLGACQLPAQHFAGMSDEELHAYNADRAVMDQVVCRKEARTSSYIRKTHCQTVRQIVYELENSVMALQVLDFGGGASALRGGN